MTSSSIANANPVLFARKLRREAWNSPDNTVAFPIDPYVIAEQSRVRVVTTPLPQDTAGFIRKDPETAEVVAYLNANDGEQRRRFTLAHELGHYMFHRNAKSMSFAEKRDDLATRGTDPHEVFANRFAAELLMPGTIIKKWWARGDDPETIRRRLKVSSEAFAHRMRNLGLL